MQIISCTHFVALYPEVVLVEIDRKSPTLFFLNMSDVPLTRAWELLWARFTYLRW